MPTIPLPPVLWPEANDRIAPDERITAKDLLSKGGFPDSALRDGAAVMGAESGYDPNAENYCCVGLMQINAMAHKGKMGIPADETEARKWLKNPHNNVRVAYQIWQGAGGSFAPDWEAFTNGSYRRFLGRNPVITIKHTATGNAGLDGVTGAVGDVVDALTPFDELAGLTSGVITLLTDRDTWFRVGKGVLGYSLVIIGAGGLVFIIGSRISKSQAGQTAKKVAVTAATKKAPKASGRPIKFDAKGNLK